MIYKLIKTNMGDTLPKTVRIGDTSSLEKRRRVNTSAGCFLVKTEEGNVKLLVIKKVWLDGTTKYVLPKGHKEGEETLEDTALREVREESGYSDISLLRYLGSATYELDWTEIQLKTDHYFLALLNSEKEEGNQELMFQDVDITEIHNKI